MRKRIFSIFLCLAMLLTLLPQTALFASAATSGTCGSNLSWNFDEYTGTLTITGSGAMANYSHSYNLAPWSSYRSSITSVVFPSGLTSIGNYAFYHCSSLTSIVIPNGVTSIGTYAFSYCTELTGITIPDSVTSIGDYAFYYCSSLTSIVIPNGVTKICDDTFLNCSSLASITIPDSVTSIGDGAFSNCSSLTVINIPGSVRIIGDRAFFRTGLTGITIPDSVTSIGYEAFYECSSLTGATIPDGVTSLDSSVFYGCSSLTGITIPDSVTSIGGSAFSGCSSLTSITIPDSVTKIGNQAFGECTGLTSVTIGSGVTSIDDGAFYRCTGLTGITIPNNVATLGNSVFSSCSGLTSIVIPNGVTSIGTYAFSGCSSLTSVTIPDSVKSIGEHAFSNCSVLTGINIPDSVTSIGNYAFYNCRGLTSITIPEGVKSIGTSVFQYCYGLTSITIPASVTKIGDSAFDCCSHLNSVHISSIAAWCKITYENIYSSPFNYAERLYLNDTLITDLVIPDGVTSIGYEAFYNCSRLTSVTIPDSVTSIGISAFKNCSELRSVTISDGVRSIGDSAFCNCRNLSSVSLPDSVTSIGSSAFSGCSSLTGITIPDGVTSIGSSAFSRCSSLTSITIPDSVTSINNSAFYNCNSLTSIFVLNPNCNMYNTYYTLGEPETTTIYGYPNSTAQTYANQYGYTFVLLDYAAANHRSAVSGLSWMICAADRSTKLPISGATVLARDASATVSATTDSDGIAQFEFPNGTAIVTVSKEGYRNVICEAGALSSQVQCYMMEQGAAEDFYIASASLQLYSNSEAKDAHNEQIVVDLKKPYGAGEHKLTAFVNTNGKTVSRVVLRQGDNEFGLTLSEKYGCPCASISLPSVYGSLVADQAVFLYAVATDGTVSPAYKLSLKLTDDTANVEQTDMFQTDENGNITAFSIGQKFSMTLPENIPVFGGTELTFLDTDWIPVKISKDTDGVCTLAFGPKWKNSENGNSPELISGDISRFVDNFKKARNQYRYTDTAIDYLKTNTEMSKLEYDVNPGKISPEMNACGYFKLNPNGELLEGGILLKAKVKYSYQGQAFIGYIPVYYEVGGGFGVSLEGTFFEWDDEAFRAKLEGKIEAELSGKVGAGIGIAKVFTVGLWGEAKLIYTWEFPDNHNLLKLKGGAGLEVKLLGSTVASTDWLDSAGAEIVIYDSNEGGGGGFRSNAKNANPASLLEDMDYTQKVTPVSRDYLDSTGRWGGTAASVRRGVSDAETTTLQSSIYPDAEPVLMQTDDGKTVLLWLADNAQRDAINRTMLVYSMFDEENDAWSAPTAVCDDGCADFYPAADGDFVVWHKSKTVFAAEGTTLDEMAQNGEIYLAKWNGSGFDPAVAVTDNAVMDTTPAVCADGDSARIVWVRNANNNIFGTDNANLTLSAQYENGTVSAETVLASGVNAVTGLSCGRIGTVPAVAFTIDGDNDLSTTDDWELYLSVNGTCEQLTQNSVTDSRPLFSDALGTSALYWYAGGSIMSCTDADGQTAAVVLSSENYTPSDRFTVIGNGMEACILWASSSDALTVSGAYFRSGGWTAATEIMRSSADMTSQSSVMLADGRILTAYTNATEQYEEDDSYIGTRTDLCVMYTARKTETRLTEVFADETQLLSDGKVEISATVTNCGTTELTTVHANVTDSSGAVIYDGILDCSLGLNESKPILLECLPQDLPAAVDWTVMICAPDEENEEDNSMVLEVGCADVAVSCVTKNTAEATALVVGEVKNLGAETASGITVSLLTADGEVGCSTVVDDLAAGETAVVTFHMVSNDSFRGTKEYYLIADAANDCQPGNNEAYVVLPFDIFDTCAEHTWDSGIVVDEPVNCLTPGHVRYTCVICAEQKTEEIIGNHLQMDPHPAVEPTCTEAGSIAYWECKDCGIKYTDADATAAADNVELPALGHQPGELINETDDYWEYQCLNGAHTFIVNKDCRLQVMSVCGAVVNFSDSGSYPWTFSENNSVVGTNAIISSNQGKDSSNSSTTISLTSAADFVLSFDYRVSSESNWDKLTIKVDDTTVANAISGSSGSSYSAALSAGTHTLTLSYTKDSSSSSGSDTAYIYNINVGTHNWDEGTVTANATCLHPGSIVYTCRNCGAARVEELAALPHNWTEDTARYVAPTCTETGSRTQICSACETVMTEVIPATGHQQGEKLNETDTYWEYQCLNGDHTYTVYKDARLQAMSVCGIEVSFSDSGSYPWSFSENNSTVGANAIISSNQGVNSSTSSTTVSFTAAAELTLSFDYRVSSESGYDKLTIKVDDTTVANAISGTRSSSYSATLSAGTHTLTLSYSKDGSVNNGTDTGYIYNIVARAETACTHSWDDGTATTAATCTQAGVMTYTCTLCGETKNEPIPATGHNYVDGVCVCGAELKIVSASLRLDENLNLVYAVQLPEDIENPYMVFTFHSTEITVTDYTVNADGRYCFELADINPQCMGDNISATLYATCDGTEYTDTVAEYSVKDYCVNQLAKTDDAALKTLLSDILTYGAAAQIYMDYKTDALVTDGLDLTPSTFTALDEKTASYTGKQDADIRWTAATLVLSNDLAARFSFCSKVLDGLTVEASINDRTQIFDSFEDAGNGKYFITFDGIKATEFDDTVTARFVRNGERIGAAVNYSVNTYICSMQNSDNAALQALVRALYNYGASAKAYAG